MKPSASGKLLAFTHKSTQMAIQKSVTLRFHPKNSVSSFPLIFEINSTDAMIDWMRTHLYLKFKLENSDGSPIDETKAGIVSVINYIGSTFFSRVRIYAQNALIFDSLETHSYKAYIESLLFEPEEIKKTLLVSGLFYEDSGNERDQCDENKNVGFKKRRNATKNAVFTTIAPIYADIFAPNTYYPRLVDYRIELFRNNDDFLLMASKISTEDVQLKLVQAEMRVHAVFPHASFSLAFEKTLLKTPAVFNIKKVKFDFVCLHNKLLFLGGMSFYSLGNRPFRSPLHLPSRGHVASACHLFNGAINSLFWHKTD